MKTLKEYLKAPGGRNQFESCVDEIMDWFDFEKIANVMDFLDWSWVVKDKDPDTLLEKGYRVFFDDDFGAAQYIPKTKDVMNTARRIINMTVEGALEAEERGEFERRYTSDSAGFYCELEIVDDELRKRAWGDDAPDDFEHSVDIVLRFVLEDNLGKFV